MVYKGLNIRYKDGKDGLKQVFIGTFEPLDYFGEDPILSHFKDFEFDMTQSKFNFSVWTGNEPVTLFLMAVHDGAKRIPRELRRTSLSECALDPHRVAQCLLKQADKRKWEAFKAKEVDLLFKERFKDPRMDRQTFHSKLRPLNPFRF